MLYRGPFLDGLSIADSPAFDEWMLLKGEETAAQRPVALDRLASLHLTRRNCRGGALGAAAARAGAVPGAGAPAVDGGAGPGRGTLRRPGAL